MGLTVGAGIIASQRRRQGRSPQNRGASMSTQLARLQAAPARQERRKVSRTPAEVTARIQQMLKGLTA